MPSGWMPVPQRAKSAELITAQCADRVAVVRNCRDTRRGRVTATAARRGANGGSVRRPSGLRCTAADGNRRTPSAVKRKTRLPNLRAVSARFAAGVWPPAWDGNSPIGEFDQHLRMAALGRAPADEGLAAQLVQRRHQRRLPHDPCAVFRDYLVACAVAADDKGIAPLARSADIDAIRRRPFADLPGVKDFAHGSPAFLEVSLKRTVECPVEFGLRGDGPRQFRLHSGTLAAREVAPPQLGPQLLDMIVKRDHRPLLPWLWKTRRRRRCRAGARQGRRRRRAAGRGGADFVERNDDRRVPARSLRSAKLEGPRILGAAWHDEKSDKTDSQTQIQRPSLRDFPQRREHAVAWFDKGN